MASQPGASQIKARLPVDLLTLEQKPLSVVVTLIDWTDAADGDAPRCEITLEATGAQSMEIMASERFHLFADVMNARPTFEDAEPVEIRLALRDAYARKLASSGGDSETVLNALLPEADSYPELKQTESWLALELMQNMALPASFHAEGTLKHGLQTGWRAAAARSGSDRSSSSPAIRARIDALLTQLQLRFEAFNDHIFKMRFHLGNQSWITLLQVDEQSGSCNVYSVFPQAVAQDQRESAALQLLNINYELLSGAFELDAEDGELRFRTTLHHASAATEAILAGLLSEHRHIMEQFMPVAAEWA